MARKRSNAEGSIYYRDARNRWEAVLVTGRRDDGRLIRRTFTARTRKAVTAKLDEARAALDQGLNVPDARTTIADYGRWWAQHVLPGEGLAAKTERWYIDMLAGYVIPQVGHRTLTGPNALTPSDVEAMASALGRDGYSHRVTVAARTTIGKVLRDAQQRGLLSRNVARVAKPPRDRGAARKVKALTVDEVGDLLGRLEGTRWHPVALVGVTTGLRPGELLALHWADVHLDGAEPHLSVRHALTHAGGTPALKAPKRERSYRTVPLAPEAVVALRDWRRTQAAERLAAGPEWLTEWPGLIFTGPTGRPQRGDTYYHALTAAVPGAHPHRLRHAYLTHLLEAGTPIHHVAELAGDTVATVEATYSHVLRPKDEVVDTARGILGRVGRLQPTRVDARRYSPVT